MDELWAFVCKKQKQVKKHEIGSPKGEAYTYVALAASSCAIVSHLTGKRSGDNTDEFIQDIRDRAIGTPRFRRTAFCPCKNAIRDAFAGNASHGVIVKTCERRGAPLQPG